MSAKKNDWVQIYFVALNPEERASNIPEDTKKVPLEIKIKGFLQNDFAEIGDEVEIKTTAGRKVSGKMIAVNPIYDHNFGKPIDELLHIGNELREEGEKIE